MSTQVHVPDHPFIRHHLAVARDKNTPMPAFRAALTELGRWLTYECCRDWLPMHDAPVETPLGVSAPASRLEPELPVAIVPILRAGLALTEGCLPLLPGAKILHLGYRRDEETRQAHRYLTGLPSRLPQGMHFLILEPMLATGGTMLQVLEEMQECGADLNLIRVISILSSQPAIERIGAKFPQPQIFCAAIDPEIDERAFIVPGLGDAGDRAFGTEGLEHL